MSKHGPHVFILSWERPLYLWACLDALYRHTRAPCRFVIADNGSRDPLVRQVIEGFRRRGMFHGVHLETDNDPHRVPGLIERYRHELGPYVAYIESDTVVLESAPCWLEVFTDYMECEPRLGLIGSVVDRRDFVSMEQARRLHPHKSEDDLAFLSKRDAPMRSFEGGGKGLVAPHNPPGRLLMFRTAAHDAVGFAADHVLHSRMQARGWGSQIATDVVHRHLSLLNLFDYPDYDRASRDAFFARLSS